MAETLQCDNCGAVLGDEDLFCGECGTPRLATVSTPPEPQETTAAPEAPPEPVEEIPALAPAPTPAPTTPPRPVKPATAPAGATPKPAGPPADRRRIAMVMAGLLAAVALALLILGLVVAFLIPQSDVGQAGTPDMILGASVICFCPGALALTGALTLWLVLIRRR